MLQKYKEVDTKLRHEIDQLIMESAHNDNIHTQIFTDASLNVYEDMHCAFTYHDRDRLAGFLFVFAPTKNEIEITALVLPAYRRQGVFKALLNEAVNEGLLFGYQKGLLVCNAANKTGMQLIEHWKCTVHHIEYSMDLQLDNFRNIPEGFSLELATMNDIVKLSALSATIFNTGDDDESSLIKNSIHSPDRIQWKFLCGNEITGMCSAMPEGKQYSIYGLGIRPDARRKGYARVLLDLVSNFAFKYGAKTLCLDVDSENPPAIKLYQSYGFKEKSITNYFNFDLA